MASRTVSRTARSWPLTLAACRSTPSAHHQLHSTAMRRFTISTRTSAPIQQNRKINMASVASSTISDTPQPPPKMVNSKREGDISDAFFSLSHAGPRPPLPDRFRELKQSLVQGHEQAVIKSWERLLDELEQEIALVEKLGPAIVPSIEFSNLDQDMTRLRSEIQKRGVAVIRGVVPEAEARAYKAQIEEYVKQNPSTKAFPQHDPQVYELYWSSPQLRARSHPNLLRASRALMDLWHSSDPSSEVSLAQPLSYADRLRIRQPGDASFALGPHIDGGSVERWERHGYGVGGVYDAVFQGRWGSHPSSQARDKQGEYDPWDVSTRVNAEMNNYSGLGACSAFRMFQGWLSMSRTAPGEGTLKVNPMLRHAMAYVLLRPFFEPIQQFSQGSAGEFLSKENWRFMPAGDAEGAMNSDLQGAVPGHGQELTNELHPHLQLDKSMVHVPEIRPGDFVVWHCDTIHAVDKVHAGTSDSSVLYIPVCPTTKRNAEYMLTQREAFLKGTPGPDFPGGKGESEHIGRPTEEFLHQVTNEEGLKAFGFQELVGGESEGEKKVMEKVNRILGF